MTRPSSPPLARTSLLPASIDAHKALETLAVRGCPVERADVASAVIALADHAPALVALVHADPDLLVDVLDRPLARGDSESSLRGSFLAATRDLGEGPELHRVLRRLRHRAVVRIALREIERLADVDETSREMAALAAGALEAAYAAVRRTFEERHGRIEDASGRSIPFVVLGMGKLGGGELNLGSDVDLIYVYGTDEGTVADGSSSVHEAFARIAVGITRALAEPTEDGFCFRVDLRLRPEGSSGPIVNALASAERYYESFGRIWERAAMLRARPIAGDRQLGQELLDALRSFIYPRPVDPRIIEEMRKMVSRSRRELSRDPERDVKLCRGGIREAEFTIQTLQLLFGGQNPVLQTPSTPKALRQLRSVGLLGHRESMQLGADWALLRRVEHRIHLWTGYQTHSLPSSVLELGRFARSLGYDDAESFQADFDDARSRVAQLFDSLADESSTSTGDRPIEKLVDRVVSRAPDAEIADAIARALPVDDPDEAASHLRRMTKNPHSPFGAIGLERAPTLASSLLREVRESAYPDAALRHLAEFFARIGADWSYDRALVEQPRLARRLVSLFGASSTLAAGLIGHPETVDSLFAGNATIPTEAEILAAHQEPPLDSVLIDEETFSSALRRRHRELTLRIGLAHVATDVDLAIASERLTTLADCQIERALAFSLAAIEARHGSPRIADDGRLSGFCIVGLGKLGSRELGFGSDLDLMAFFGSEGDTDGGPDARPIPATDFYARVTQRLMRILTNPDVEGRGYEVDMRLRPNGTRGPLAVAVPTFDGYHTHHAADWERQVLTRARVVAGDRRLGEALTQRFHRLAFDYPAPAAAELADMRERIELELGAERVDRFHVKYGYGGFVDVEFLAQWLAMRHGNDPRVRIGGTVATLEALRAIGALDRDDQEALVDGFEIAREVEQASRLLDEHRDPVIVPGGPVADRIARRLRMRNRDGLEPGAVLVATWQRTATEVRAIFERLVAPIATEPPWERKGRSRG